MDRILPSIITATSLALPLVALAQQDTVKCQQPDGKFIYQNWPCGTKPPVDKPAPEKPDYSKAVECGMQTSAENMIRRAMGMQPLPVKCGQP